MKMTSGLMILLATQVSFAASVLECDFAILKNNNTVIIKKSQELKKSNTGILVNGVELVSEFASLDFENDLGIKVSVSGSISDDGNSINSEIIDLNSGSLSRSRGENKMHSELLRTDDSGDQVEGIGAVCTIKKI
jgi:hypothetical protein